MPINLQTVADRVCQAYVLCQYLRDLASELGAEAYRTNLVRMQHGPGSGFFGVSNNGSMDCASAAFRRVTDALGQTNRDWSGIEFKSETCIDVDAPTFVRGNGAGHRVEHTWAVAEIFRLFEREYIELGREFTPSDLAKFIVPKQIVCLIRTREQISSGRIDAARPFSRYSCRVLFRGVDVSELSLVQLIQLNHERYAQLLAEIDRTNFATLVDKYKESLLRGTGGHTLPQLALAVSHGTNEFELLCRHYRLKLQKRTDPDNSRWFNASDAARFSEWSVANGMR